MTTTQLVIGIVALLLSAAAVSCTVVGGAYWLGGRIAEVNALGASFAKARAEDTVRNDAILAVPELVRGLGEVRKMTTDFTGGLAKLPCGPHHDRLVRVETDVGDHDKLLVGLAEKVGEERGHRQASSPDIVNGGKGT